ncbi:MAG TPA: hypothetical protein VGK29_23930 [Paludibaculum sp.]|jgi:hypothetical protein
MVVSLLKRHIQAIFKGGMLLVWLGCASMCAQALDGFGTRELMVSDPWTLFAKLRGASAEDQSSAYEELFGDRLPKKLPAFEGRLLILQMDSDPQPEAVLILDILLGRVVFVFDRDNAGWWKVGRFSNRVRNSFAALEGMVEARLISDSVNELIIRDFGWMTEGRSTVLQIFRLDRGVLHRVFETVEFREGPVMGSERDTVEIERTYLHFPKPGLIVAHRLSARIPGYGAPDMPEEVLRAQGKTVACAASEWSANILRYVESPILSKEYCGRIRMLRTRGASAR